LKKNLPLIIGGLIICLVLAVMLFPQWFTKVNPYGTEIFKYQHANGIQSPPFPPATGSPLGTDEMGRDILSFIIYGTRLTIMLGLFVVLGRFLVALPLGLAAGFGSYICRTLINQFNVIFSAIPSLIVSVIVLKMNFFRNLDRQNSILAFVLVLSFVGWAKLGAIISERVQEILARSFITGEIAIGKSSLRIALENVIPHLATELIVLFFMEIASALAMIMQLGIFEVFVGNIRFVASTEGGAITFVPVSFEPEWASMLATARKFVQTAPWLVISPAVAFFISILGFNMIGEGLRVKLNERDSKFIVQLRQMLRFQLKGKGFTKTTFIKVACGLLIVISIFALSSPAQSSNAFSLQDAAPLYTASTEFDQVVIGTGQAKETAERIAQALQAIGLEPLDKQGFIVSYPTGLMYGITSGSLELTDNNQSKSFIRGKDFVITSFGEHDLSGGIYDARQSDLYSLDYALFAGKFVLLDTSLYPGKAAKNLSERIMNTSQAAGVLCISEEELPGEIGDQIFPGAVLWITPQTAEQLVAAMDAVIKVRVTSCKLESQGRNIIGVLKGQDVKMDKETIIIGLGYNFQTNQQDAGNKRILFGLELAKQLQSDKKNRNIIFAFWDGTISDKYSGVRYYSRNTLVSPTKTPLYIDLSQFNAAPAAALYLRTDQAPLERYLAFSIGHQLETAIKDYKLPLKSYKPQQSEEKNMEEVMYYDAGIPTLSIKTVGVPEPGNSGISLDSFGNALLDILRKNSY
jgi:peptide/nickel transport system permease protein